MKPAPQIKEANHKTGLAGFKEILKKQPPL